MRTSRAVLPRCGDIPRFWHLALRFRQMQVGKETITPKLVNALDLLHESLIVIHRYLR